MPHIKIECPENLSFDSNALLKKIHTALAGKASINLSDLKSRVFHLRNSLSGSGEGGSFLHCELALLEGRSPEQRQELSEVLFSLLQSEFGHAVPGKISSITVEVREMERLTYKKLLC